MNELAEQYWARALKIAHQYDAEEVAFADLTGLADEFAASFSEQINDLPEPQRATACTALDTKLVAAIASDDQQGNSAKAFGELLVAINRTPIY